jgi:cell division protein FtsQ
VNRGLLTPRRAPSPLTDLGELPTPVARQRVGSIRRRRTTRTRVKWRRVAGWSAAILVLALATGVATRWLETSPLFVVKSVEVRGASRLPAERIVSVAAISSGTPLWRVDPTAVVARLETLPEIRRADVIRELPDRVTIMVEERRPFTLVHAGRLHWLDEDGRVLGEEREAVPPPVPVISGLTEDELLSMRTSPSARTRAAISLIRTLLRSGSALASEISEIDMSRREGPVLYTVDGVEVRLGQEGWDERLARLEGVLAQIASDDVSAIDLRFRDQVILRKGGR